MKNPYSSLLHPPITVSITKNLEAYGHVEELTLLGISLKIISRQILLSRDGARHQVVGNFR